ncbi:MAG: hydrolase [Clostridiales bacterium]|nr:hydrolase [Clostridiales bacterium]
MNKRKRAFALLCTALAAVMLAGSAFAQTPLLRRGSRGEDVRQMQGNLIYLGYLNDVADGIFGPKTEAAVRLYQSKNALAVDGIVGSATRGKVVKEVLLLNKILDTAKQYLGLPYKTAGTSPETGFDCSGFTQYVFRQAGISIPRVSRDQAKAGTAVSYSQMRPGDLVCFNSPVSHVGIYLGGGKFIHSPKPGDKIKITELRYMDLTAIRRFTGVV